MESVPAGLRDGRIALPSLLSLTCMAKKKNAAAVELGRKGGKASAERLTDQQRKEKARKAAQARWTKRRQK